MEVLKTTDYSKFIFLDENRDGPLDQNHIKKLMESIKSRNMLEFKPIECNSNMEIIDGQHRCKAAQNLGVPIYYTVNPELKTSDMIALNIVKAWTPKDFMNFYVKNKYPEYLKLEEFMKKNNLDIRVAIKMTRGNNKKAHHDFKVGTYVFVEEENGELFDIIWQTIDYIKKLNGFSYYTNTTRFWTALIKLVRHVDFDKTKWFTNVKKMVERFDVRATEQDYLRMFMEVHNWHNPNKVDLLNKPY